MLALEIPKSECLVGKYDLPSGPGRHRMDKVRLLIHIREFGATASVSVDFPLNLLGSSGGVDFLVQNWSVTLRINGYHFIVRY